jgi:hypothetical protein
MGGSPKEYIDEKIKDFEKHNYTRRLWENQPKHVEVWLEKDALASLFEEACYGYRVIIFPSRGYSSYTKVAEALFERFCDLWLQEPIKQVIILYFTDHDPSGLDMELDLKKRFKQYFGQIINERMVLKLREVVEDKERFKKEYEQMRHETMKRLGDMGFTDLLTIKRIALSYGQVRDFDLAPNPTKEADPRKKKYIEEYGSECWELDAVPPDEMIRIIQEAIKREINFDRWNETIKRIEDEKEVTEKDLGRLSELLKKWYDQKAG